LTGHVGQRLPEELSRVFQHGGPGAEHAEVALGNGPIRQRLRSSILALAEHRGPNSSICPSDAARAVGGEDWRDLMVDACELALELAKTGHVEITQRGEVLDPDGAWRGPMRIRTVAH